MQVLGVVVCGCEAPLLLDRPPPRRDAARLPITPYPDAFERQYRAALRPLLEDLAGLAQNLADMLDDYTADASRARLAEERRKQLAAKLQTMREAVLARWTTKRIVGNIPLERIVDGVDRLNEKATIAQVARAIEVTPDPLPENAEAWVLAADTGFSRAKRDTWAKANAKLIRSIAEEHLDRVAELVDEGFRAGSRASVVAERLVEATGVAQRRAQFIARDQIASLQGQVVQARQDALGIKRYRWRTVGDARVRTAHALREGKIFRWDQAPADGHPGQPINCRCYAEPVLENVLAALKPGG